MLRRAAAPPACRPVAVPRALPRVTLPARAFTKQRDAPARRSPPIRISAASLRPAPVVRAYATESSSPPFRSQRFSRGGGSGAPPPPRLDDSIGPDPEQLEKNLAEWLMTLAMVAGVAVALLADAPSQDKEQNGRVTQQNLGIFMLIGASSFALWAGMDYFRAASALADQLPVRGRTLRVVAFSLFLGTCFAGASALPPRISPTPALPPAKASA